MISPAELLRDILNQEGPGVLAPHDAIVGPANDTQQQEGVISIMPAGLPVVEKYVPVQWMRGQIRCIAGTLSEVETIGQAVYGALNGRVRVKAHQASTGEDYLIHLMNINAGPSAHFDSAETWEVLVFVEMMIGTTPVFTP